MSSEKYFPTFQRVCCDVVREFTGWNDAQINQQWRYWNFKNACGSEDGRERGAAANAANSDAESPAE